MSSSEESISKTRLFTLALADPLRDLSLSLAVPKLRLCVSRMLRYLR